ncbi:MAG: ATP-binding protein [Paludibacter sp.]|nr:ATP-binding protein [Paludibacter sp.]
MFKIAIIGPESTGKTELARNLSEYFNASWIPEYAREYVEHLKRPYTFDDVCKIAKKQIELEKKYSDTESEKKGFLFFDTELIITKVWFEYKYQKVPDFLNQQLDTRFFDFYLLCAPDLVWEADTVREHGTDREYFFKWYKREIEQTGKPFVIIKGFGNQRIKNAVLSIENYFQQ